MNPEKEFQKRYQSLNTQQKIAVDTIEGPVMVVAGPGMGKTELLALRVANILLKTDTPAESILCLTFTDSAAQNMLERLTSLIGKEAYNMAIHTFHSFATEVINHNQEFFFNGAKFKTADNLAQTRILTEVIDSLSPDSALISPGKEFKYDHIRKVKQAISNIKKEGFTPEEFEEILIENQNTLQNLNPKLNKFFSRPIRSNKEKVDIINNLPALIQELVEINQNLPESKYKNRGIKKISQIVLDQLQTVNHDLQNQDRPNTKEITSFKQQYLVKNSENNLILKDTKTLKINFELCQVYKQYKNKLYAEGYFDFDDMLIEVNKSFETSKELSYNYKEKYLYILVDEFQDTNLSQTQLLDNIIDLEITNNNPNIMVVGDDDQAIYKFQGANIENILGFQEKYTNTQFITLHKNYRSHQKILDFAKEVIEDCTLRLGDKIKIDKNLVSASQNGENQTLSKPKIYNYHTRLESLGAIAKSIRQDIENGIKPNQIAVLVKKHKQLDDFIKVLNFHKIPVKYEKSSNVLELKYIQEIITIIRFINSVNNANQETKEELLHKITSFEMFNLEPLSIYKASSIAYSQKIPWLDAILEYSNQNHKDSASFKEVHSYFLSLAKDAQIESVEVILDKILGSEKDNTLVDEQQDDTNEYSENNLNTTRPLYKFSLKKVIQDKPDYLIFLSGLKSFIDNLRQYKPNKTIYTQDFVDYIDLLEDNKIPINDNSPYSQQENAVELMTVYKAKGLEFENIYILDCNNNLWNSSRSGNGISLPTNTPFSPQRDNTDDFIRVFFVAITRAKNQLKLFRYDNEDIDRKTNELLFLLDKKNISVQETNKQSQNELIKELETWLSGDIQPKTLNINEKEWLKPFFKTYKLSATNLFNFLDVTSGGPQFFLERNLLRFPQSKNPFASYGTAIHDTISQNYVKYIQEGVLPTQDSLISIFHDSLTHHRLSKVDFEKMLHKGNQALPIFYDQVFNKYTQNMKVEIDFKFENVIISGAPITGKIDQILIDKNKKTIKVTDLKTGAPSQKWDIGTPYAKKKLVNYNLQLVFYKLLVENSRSFGGYTVNNSSLMYVEPERETTNIIELEKNISKEEADNLSKLIGIVYNKIINFDFPDTSGYSKDYTGIKSFINDLLEGKV
jgi:DNA helicase II / ATP-dependent DNA helicase PcrA